MMVAEVMTREPVTAAEQTSLQEALLLLQRHHIRHLPVTEGNALIGIVSDRDIRRASPSFLSGVDRSTYEQVLSETPVSRIMTREPFTVGHDTKLVEAVRTLVEKKTGSLPVVNGTQLVGIFTEIDALKVLLRTLIANGG